MRVPISLVVFGAAVLGVVPLHAQRPDSDLQAKARELLRQKMSELDSQQSTASNAPVTPPQQPQVPAQPDAATPSQAPVVPAAEAPAPAPAVTTPAPAPDVQAKAQKKSRKKKAKSDSQQPQPPPQSDTVKAVQAGSATPATPATPVASISTPVADAPEGLPTAPSSGTLAPPAGTLTPPVVPEAPPSGTLAPPLGMPPSNRDSQAKAEQALRQMMTELDAQQRGNTPLPGPGQVNSAKQKQPNVTPTYPIAGANYAVTPPPLGIPDSKQARLADLLQLYKADKLTPLEYHTQRAKILSEP
jgi:hypothetical protein